MSTATLDFARFQVGRSCTATLARLGATLINFKGRGMGEQGRMLPQPIQRRLPLCREGNHGSSNL